jgi:hypothetical protein
MPSKDSVGLRNAEHQAFVTALGGGAFARLYTGTKPAGGPEVAASGTQLAQLNFGSTSVTDANGGTAGSVAAGRLTFGGYTQNPAAHVAGTPGYIRWFTSAGVALRDTDVSSAAIAGNVQFNGTVAPNVPITGAIWYDDGDV